MARTFIFAAAAIALMASAPNFAMAQKGPGIDASLPTQEDVFAGVSNIAFLPGHRKPQKAQVEPAPKKGILVVSASGSKEYRGLQPVQQVAAVTTPVSAMPANTSQEARALMASPPRSLQGASNLACVAVAIYHEARNQSTLGQLAVGSVIQQRAMVRDRWGSTPCEVVTEKSQFSFMTSKYGFPAITEMAPWHTAVQLAVQSLTEGPLPQLHNADHYHTAAVYPVWRKKMTVVGQIGAHIFYRDPETNG
jgi:spore germination cell wall hydrolase CwlJ-like protein